MPEKQSFQVACATWKHVQVFCDPALRRGRPLTVRLPFSVDTGQRVSLVLELPNHTCVEVESLVQGANPGADGRTSARLQLVGLDLATVSRLGQLMAEEGVVVTSLAEAVDGCPAPQNASPRLEEMWKSLRECSALEHFELGDGANLEEVERVMRERLLEVHPDVLAASGEEPHLAREIVIELERARRALERSLSDSATVPLSGAVLCDANVDDWHATAPSPRPLTPMRSSAPPQVAMASTASSTAVEVTIDPVDEALDSIDAGKPAEARARLADALRERPRDRQLRGLYHFAYARELLDRGDAVRATTQLEAALAHDAECVRAQRALDALRGASKHKPSPLWRRLFGGE